MLLTGGSGMVGRNLQEHPGILEWDLYAPSSTELDLTDSIAVFNYIENLSPDIILHAAGKVGGIQANIDSPVAFLEQNMMIGRNVIMGGFNSGVKNLINLASSCIYPLEAKSPLKEDTLLSGPLEKSNEGYALAKISILRLCEYITREDSSYIYKSIIPCNLFGRYDNFNSKESHLLPAILQKVYDAKKNSKDLIEIWGDGTARREFMSCGDLADILICAAKDLSQLPDLMNAGVGHDYSVLEYYQRVSEIAGWDGEFVFDVSKPKGVQQKLCDVTRLNDWGWKSKISLEEGIEIAYNYLLEIK